MDEDMALEYMIEGIPDYLLKSHARAWNYRSLVDLLDGMQRITHNELRRESRKGTGSRPSATSHFNSRQVKSSHNSEDQKNTIQTRCYNCHEFGHLSTACKYPAKERNVPAKEL